jgi:surface antigen
MLNSKISLMLGALTLTLVSVSLSAQNLNFLRESPIGWLDDQDRAILRATIDAVMAAPDGTTTDWLNPETGSRGRLQVLDTFEDFGTTCRKLKMLNEAKSRKAGAIYQLCLSSDGQWRFAPSDEAPKVAPAEPVTEE